VVPPPRSTSDCVQSALTVYLPVSLKLRVMTPLELIVTTFHSTFAVVRDQSGISERACASEASIRDRHHY